MFQALSDCYAWGQWMPVLDEVERVSDPRGEVGDVWTFCNERYRISVSNSPAILVLDSTNARVEYQIESMPDGGCMVNGLVSARPCGSVGSVVWVQKKILAALQEGLIREPYLALLPDVRVSEQRSKGLVTTVAELVLARRPRDVFQFLTDHNRYPEWMTHIERGDDLLVDPNWPNAGSELVRHTGNALIRWVSRLERERLEIVSCQAEREFVFRRVEWVAPSETRFILKPDSGNKTLLRAEETVAISGSIAGRLFGAVIAAAPFQLARQMARLKGCFPVGAPTPEAAELTSR